ncbi:MAG: hypothetical protein P9L93_00830 [Candidatus Gorgyraea atricola]|nr:hypothetical protein [Candidatus Gorgyraea atricola]
MRKIGKGHIVALILMLVGVFLGQSITYSDDTLRLPMDREVNERQSETNDLLAPSYIKRKGPKCTIKIMGKTFKGRRNNVRNDIFNMLLNSEEISLTDNELQILSQFVSANEFNGLVYEAKFISEKRRKIITSLTETIEEKQPEIEKQTMEQRLFLCMYSAWGKSGGLNLITNILKKLRAKELLKTPELGQIASTGYSNLLVNPHLNDEGDAKSLFGNLGIKLFKEFNLRYLKLKQCKQKIKKLLLVSGKQPQDGDRPILIEVFTEMLKLQVFLLRQYITIGETYGVPKETLLEFSMFDPKNHVSSQWGEDRMPNVGELLTRANAQLASKSEDQPNLASGEEIKEQSTENITKLSFSTLMLSDGFRTEFIAKDSLKQQVHVRGIYPDKRIIRNYIAAIRARQANNRRTTPQVFRVYAPLLKLDIEGSMAKKEMVTQYKDESDLPSEIISFLRQAEQEGLFELAELRSREDYIQAARDLGLAEEEFFHNMTQNRFLVFISGWIGPNVHNFIAENATNEQLMRNLGLRLGETLAALHNHSLIAGDTHLEQFVVRGAAKEVFRIDLVNIYSLREATHQNFLVEFYEIASRLARGSRVAFDSFKEAYARNIDENTLKPLQESPILEIRQSVQYILTGV